MQLEDFLPMVLPYAPGCAEPDTASSSEPPTQA